MVGVPVVPNAREGETRMAAAPSITISALDAVELDIVLDLLARCELPEAGLADHAATTLVAKTDGAIVGSAALELYGTVALLRSVAVEPALRGHMIGSRLVDAALAMAQAQGAHTIFLLTETAVPYFVRRGFVPVARGDVAPAVQQSEEFTHACPASAQAMSLTPAR